MTVKECENQPTFTKVINECTTLPTVFGMLIYLQLQCLSLPVQLSAYWDLSPKWPIMFWVRC